MLGAPRWGAEVVWDLDLLILDEALNQHLAHWAPFLLERSNYAHLLPHGLELPSLCPSIPTVGAPTLWHAVSTLTQGSGAHGPSQPQMASNKLSQTVSIRGDVSGKWPWASC